MSYTYIVLTMVEDTAPDQSIAEAHIRCIDAFEGLHGSTHGQPAQQSPPVQGLSLRNMFDKYKLRSGNLDAMHSGQNWKLSLDYRLREAAFYKEQVTAAVSCRSATESWLCIIRSYDS